MPNNFSFKIIIVGAVSVGKTSLVLNYVKKIFRSEYLPTIGVDIYSKDLIIDNTNITTVIWDIAGQRGWEIMHKSYFKGADGCLAVFDLTRKNTLNNLENWIKKVKEYSGKETEIILLGNKKDLKVAIEVTPEDVEAFRKEFNYPYYETSAKTGENVKEAFEELMGKISSKYKK